MKKFVRIVGIIVLICCLFGSVGCGNKYNAELFNNAEQWIRDDFLRENRVKAYYPNENYDENDEQSERYIYDETAPLTRTFIISDNVTFDEIFKGDDIVIDFANEILLLYIHSEIYPAQWRPLCCLFAFAYLQAVPLSWVSSDFPAPAIHKFCPSGSLSASRR